MLRHILLQASSASLLLTRSLLRANAFENKCLKGLVTDLTQGLVYLLRVPSVIKGGEVFVLWYDVE